MEEEEEYKQQANALKEQGNAAFQAGDVTLAINYFSQAIEIDPDNHVLYSNRSAAYMKADSKSKALHDAERCVELAPNWAKGYNRLGVAQQSLKRFTAAMDSLKKGIELEPNNTALWAALKSCQEAYEVDKKYRFKEAEAERAIEQKRLQRREDAKKEILREKVEEEQAKQTEDLLSGFFTEIIKDEKLPEVPKPTTSSGDTTTNDTNNNPEDDMLAMFFDEVTKKEEDKKAVPSTAAATTVPDKEIDGKEEEPLLSEKYTKQDLGSGKVQVERILTKHYQWKNLNPYVVMDMDIDATEEDIKFRYKKLSLKVHPDRLRDLDNAREAFEQVKDAYHRLMDPDQRKTIIMHIENVTMDLKKERRKLIKDGKRETDLPDFDKERARLLLKHFADIEQMKRRSETNLRAYSAREKMQETEEEEKQQRFEEFEKDWTEENRRDKRVGNWRDFSNDPTAKKVKATNYKEESRENSKHGVVKLETWKKSWK